ASPRTKADSSDAPHAKRERCGRATADERGWRRAEARARAAPVSLSGGLPGRRSSPAGGGATPRPAARGGRPGGGARRGEAGGRAKTGRARRRVAVRRGDGRRRGGGGGAWGVLQRRVAIRRMHPMPSGTGAGRLEETVDAAAAARRGGAERDHLPRIGAVAQA